MEKFNYECINICGDHYRNLHLAYAILKTNLVKNYKIIVFKRENIIQNCPKSLTKNQKKIGKFTLQKDLKLRINILSLIFQNFKNESDVIYIKDINELIKLNKKLGLKKF